MSTVVANLFDREYDRPTATQEVAMLNYVVRRLMIGAVTLFLLTIAVFLMLRVMPGDQVVCPGGFCDREYMEARRVELGLDKPYFPVSVDASRGAAWWLLVPLAGAAGFAAWRAKAGRRA
jgi:hypothetical protein